MKLKNYLIFGIIGIFICVASVGATTIITANNITYSNKNTNADSVELALNELFDSVTLTERIEALEAKVNNILNKTYPVGTIYTSIKNTNPSTLFGGTWVSYGAGRTLVGVDGAQTEFNTVEKTGGAKTHTLTVNEMPSHSHNLQYSTDNGATFTTALGGKDGQWSGDSYLGISNSISAYASYMWNLGTTGGSQAHNNLQPYITVYMWKRTA